MLRTSSLILLTLMSLTTVGCGGSLRWQRQIDQMGVQRRTLEDQLYDLQYEYNKQVTQIQELELENEDLRAQLGTEDRSPTSALPRTSDGPELIDLNPAHGATAGIRPTIKPVTHRLESQPGTPSPPNTSATILEINRLRTVGRDLDGLPGDDTLLLHLQPRTVNGELLMIPGSVTVEAVSAEYNNPLHLGRWDITSDQVQHIIRNRHSQRTIALQLDFPGGTPAIKKIRLLVQFKPDNGTVLNAEHVLQIIPVSREPPIWKPER